MSIDMQDISRRVNQCLQEIEREADPRHKQLMLDAIIRDCRLRKDQGGLATIIDYAKAAITQIRRLRQVEEREKSTALIDILSLVKYEISELDYVDPCGRVVFTDATPTGPQVGG